MKSSRLKLFYDALFYVAGCASYAVGIRAFTAPNEIAPGGVTGISTVINYLTGFPIGILIIIINIPLFIFCAKGIGRDFTVKSFAGMALSALFIDLLGAVHFPQYTGDGILAAVFGGAFVGIGLSLVFMRGGSTGGTDIAAQLLVRKIRYIPLGRIIMVIDLCVIAFSAVVYQSIESALYAIIALYVSTQIIDSVMYGLDRCKVVLIITPETEKVTAEIDRRLGRGVTLISARGAYSGHENPIIMCALRRNEVFRLRDLVRELDPSAFVIIGDAGEILGKGFKAISE